ncbi:MAG: glycosyltransferase family 39 protein [Bacteroidota bacterium]
MTTIFWQGLGLLTLFAGLAGIAFWWMRQQRWGLALGSLLVLAFALRLFAAADNHLHPWDERYHALVGKNLSSSFPTPLLYQEPLLSYDYRQWSANHVWVHKQPVPIFLIGGSVALFGAEPLWVRFPSILLGSLCIWLTFLIGKRLFSAKVGFYAAFFQAINGLLIELASGRVATDHIDASFAFWVECGVWLSLLPSKDGRRPFWLDALTALAVGLAILSKWLPALVVGLIWAYVRWTEGWRWQIIGRGTLILFVLLGVVLPWQLWTYQHFPLEFAWEQSFNQRHIFEGLDGHGQPWWYFIERVRINYGEMVYWPIVTGTWLAFLGIKSGERQSLLALWFWVPFMFFSLVATKMQGYLAFIAPALFLWTAYVVDQVWQWGLANRWWRIIVLLFLLLSVRYSVERLKPFERNTPEWQQTLNLFAGQDPQEPFVLCGEPQYIEAMFQYGGTVYPHIPPVEQLQKWRDEGINVYIRKGHKYQRFE